MLGAARELERDIPGHQNPVVVAGQTGMLPVPAPGTFLEQASERYATVQGRVCVGMSFSPVIQTRMGREIMIDVLPEEPAHVQEKYHRRYCREFPENTLRRGPTCAYNCFALAFACRRGWVAAESVDTILEDDGYRPLAPEEEALPGDVVIYRDGDTDEFEHVGVILEMRTLFPGSKPFPYVVSKWGYGPEYLHMAARSPYGTDFTVHTERPRGR
jgi:hypothetical protein